MKNCFSIPTYCEDLHRSKIMNLLTRVRKVLPNDFKLFTRDQWIYSKGLITKIRFVSRECERVQWNLPRIFERPILIVLHPLIYFKIPLNKSVILLLTVQPIYIFHFLNLMEQEHF